MIRDMSRPESYAAASLPLPPFGNENQLSEVWHQGVCRTGNMDATFVQFGSRERIQRINGPTAHQVDFTVILITTPHHNFLSSSILFCPIIIVISHCSCLPIIPSKFTFDSASSSGSDAIPGSGVNLGGNLGGGTNPWRALEILKNDKNLGDNLYKRPPNANSGGGFVPPVIYAHDTRA
jgi:hypothetical protein